MKKDNDILSRVGRNDGCTVPEGFFEAFAAKMEASLPENPAAEKPQVVIPPRTFWQKIRPYTYMAAMFAGVWCMVKMFSLMSPANVDLSIDNNQVLSDALSDDNFVYEYIIDDVSEREIIQEMYDDSVNIDEILPDDAIDFQEEETNVESPITD